MAFVHVDGFCKYMHPTIYMYPTNLCSVPSYVEWNKNEFFERRFLPITKAQWDERLKEVNKS